jgi:hypothetical protein
MRAVLDVFLDQGFIAAGAVSLRSAQIGGSVDLGGSIGTDGSQPALYAPVMQVIGTFHWHPAAQVQGAVDLEGSSLGELDDEWTSDSLHHNGFWPVDGRLHLSGLTYERMGGRWPASVEQRLSGLRSQYGRIQLRTQLSHPNNWWPFTHAEARTGPRERWR